MSRVSPAADAARIAFGRALRIWATACGYTPSSLADVIGASDVAIGQWMRGQTRPSVRNLKLLRERGFVPPEES